MPVTQADREAARNVLDRQSVRYAMTGTFRTWDECCEAFAAHREAAVKAALEKAAGVAALTTTAGYSKAAQRRAAARAIRSIEPGSIEV